MCERTEEAKFLCLGAGVFFVVQTPRASQAGFMAGRFPEHALPNLCLGAFALPDSHFGHLAAKILVTGPRGKPIRSSEVIALAHSRVGGVTAHYIRGDQRSINKQL